MENAKGEFTVMEEREKKNEMDMKKRGRKGK